MALALHGITEVRRAYDGLGDSEECREGDADSEVHAGTESRSCNGPPSASASNPKPPSRYCPLPSASDLHHGEVAS